MSLLDNVKDIVELAKKGMTVELQQKLMEFQERELSLREENLVLKERVKELEEILNRKQSLEFDGQLYWLKTPDGKKDGPFCQRCHDTSGRMIRVQKIIVDDYDAESGRVIGRGNYYFSCFECKSKYHSRR